MYTLSGKRVRNGSFHRTEGKRWSEKSVVSVVTDSRRVGGIYFWDSTREHSLSRTDPLEEEILLLHGTVCVYICLSLNEHLYN